MCISERELSHGQCGCPEFQSTGSHLSLKSKVFNIGYPFLIAGILAIISRPSISVVQKVPNVGPGMANMQLVTFVSLLLVDP